MKVLAHGVLLSLAGGMGYFTYADSKVPAPNFQGLTQIQSSYSNRSGSVGSSYGSSGGDFRRYSGGK